MEIKKKAIRLLIGSFLAYAVLVATHLGEFWPFSVYPMFSIAGKPWTRSLVREIPEQMASSDEIWKVVGFDNLPGNQLAMNDIGVSQNDMANMVKKTKVWNEAKVRGLRSLLESELQTKSLMVYRARGEKVDNPEEPVKIEFTPFILLNSDTTIFNPNLEFQH